MTRTPGREIRQSLQNIPGGVPTSNGRYGSFGPARIPARCSTSGQEKNDITGKKIKIKSETENQGDLISSFS